MQLETVGEIVRILRSRRGLEQVELARACGWRDASAVSRIETDRIHPTRKTLVKLADALADPAVTGTGREVRAMLFLAAGLLPTADEIAEIAAELPDIDRWGQPALIVDFGWNIWDTNVLARNFAGLPADAEGRNYFTSFFQPDGPVRARLGSDWEMSALTSLKVFRAQTDARSHQRWHRTMLGTLMRLPDFGRLWSIAEPDGERPSVQRRRTERTFVGNLAVYDLPLTTDPRLHVLHVVAEDEQTARALEREAKARL